MDYFEIYKARLHVDGGTQTDSFTNASKQLIHDSFADSPSFMTIDIASIKYDARLVEGEKDNEKKLLYRPDTQINIGEYVTIGFDMWLTMDFENSKITPKSTIKIADRVLRWKDGKNVIEEPCVLQTVQYEEMRDGKYFYTPKGNILIHTQYNANTIKLIDNQRFIFGSNVYKIGGIDDFTNVKDGKGYLSINLEKTDKLQGDNFVIGVADNSLVIKEDDPIVDSGGDWLS